MKRMVGAGLFFPLFLAVGAAEAQTLNGSRASVERIYRQAVTHELHFYETSAGVRRAASQGSLVRLTGNADYGLADVSYPYLLPTTVTFVERLGAQYRAACGERLIVTSAVRPKSFRLVNSVDKSVHPTGMAVDLRRPSNPRCLEWLRRTLLAVERAGAIEAVEERNPPHFHVAVFPRPYARYLQGQGVRIAAATPSAAATIASSGVSSAAVPVATVARNPNRGTTYTVRKGDTLWSIASRHRITVESLQSANNLRTNRILVGQVIRIPDR